MDQPPPKPAADDDDPVPIFGTWRGIYTAVIVVAARLHRASPPCSPTGPTEPMTTLDWVVLGVYMVAIVAFGIWAGRGNTKMDDFFLAGRQMRWWAVGLSVMATQISAITFIGTTGQAYTDGMRFLVVYFGLPFAMVILCVTLVPVLLPRAASSPPTSTWRSASTRARAPSPACSSCSRAGWRWG